MKSIDTLCEINYPNCKNCSHESKCYADSILIDEVLMGDDYPQDISCTCGCQDRILNVVLADGRTCFQVLCANCGLTNGLFFTREDTARKSFDILLFALNTIKGRENEIVRTKKKSARLSKK